jgi:hypothetical protein
VDTPVTPNLPFSAEPPAPEIPQFRDRGTGLVVFGIIQLILGGLCALFVPFTVLAFFVSRKADTGGPIGAHIQSAVLYLALAVLFITLGAGSIQARRWARALTMVGSWVGLIFGILMTILITAMLPTLSRGALRTATTQNPDAANFSTGFMAVMLTFVIVLFAVFMIALPIAFILFYSRPDVEETCKRRDPVERWTDRVPLPVLGVSMLFATSAPYYLLQSVTTPFFPFFGRYLTGWRAGLVCICLSILDVVLARLLFRLNFWGWRLAVIALALRIISSVSTFARADLFEAYSRLGLSHHAVEVMRSNPMLRSGTMMWWSLVATGIFLGYMVWLKRYFKKSPGSPLPIEESSAPQTMV